MSKPRPTHCAWCAAPLEQADTGRPREFCSDRHRRAYARALSTEIGALIARRRRTSADDELRDVQRELFTLVSRLQGRAKRHELSGDHVSSARLTYVADDLAASVARHFSSSLRQP
ncbi:MAG: hypothetical protein GX537_05925 [Actinobacteria bacterium]|nr:hypothetical protein [Actinomycetota bacterium]